jgi:hypothetical protein
LGEFQLTSVINKSKALKSRDKYKFLIRID